MQTTPLLTGNGGTSPSDALATTTTQQKSSNSNSNNGGKKPKARLTACVMSAYDLPNRDPPSCVSITVNGQTVRTGPPSQRHKDRNSFKFSTGNTISITSDNLQELYKSTAVIQLVYPKQSPGSSNGAGSSRTLIAEYSLDQLKIHDTVWLILNLEGSSDNSSEEDDDIPPTLRLQLTLSGPYRPEIEVLVNIINNWFGIVDRSGNFIQEKTSTIKIPDLQWVVVPVGVPIVAATVVMAPIAIGIFTMTLPLSLPVTVILGFALSLVGLVLSVLYGSTKTGRSQIVGTTAPLYKTLLSTPLGQNMIYETGPRPTPVTCAQWILPTGMWQRLIISLCIDGIGSASYLIPVIAETFDIAWAPIQTILIMAMYNDNSPKLKYISFIEEILPFTDVIPSATAGWLMQYVPVILAESNNNGNNNQATATKPPMTVLAKPTVAPTTTNATPKL